MKLKHSLFTRRQFLNGLLGGWFGALAASLLYPVLKFVFPPVREPDQVVLPFLDFEVMEPNTVKNFPWGSKPGLLKKNDDGSYTAFVAVCTHLEHGIVSRIQILEREEGPPAQAFRMVLHRKCHPPFFRHPGYYWIHACFLLQPDT